MNSMYVHRYLIHTNPVSLQFNIINQVVLGKSGIYIDKKNLKKKELLVFKIRYNIHNKL